MAAGLIVLALAGLWSSGLAWPVCVIGSVAILFLVCRKLLSPGKLALDGAAWLNCLGGQWHLRMQSGETQRCSIAPDSLVLPFLVILRLSLPASAGPMTLVLARDSVSAEEWRRLQLNLRHGVEVSAG